MPSAAPIGVPPPDQREREHALDVRRCLLVRAPAGSGKTDLLTRRFLRLLAEVDDPEQIVAITFTKAAAAEMRNRILESLERAAANEMSNSVEDEFAMEALARRALARSRERGWNLIELPAELRISTIDSFCRELAVRQPLLSGLGGGLEIDERPRELYRRAARRTLEAIEGGDSTLREAIEALLLWRDNSWQEIENQLVEMLETRDRWMHEFVVARNPDWVALRNQLEQPFRNRVAGALTELSQFLDAVPHAREEILDLARFACVQSEGALHRELAELAELPNAPFETSEELEDARQAGACLAALLLTNDGNLRKQIDKRLGFPADRKREKDRLLALVADLRNVFGLEASLAAIRTLPPARYSEEDWRILRACFILLRRAAAELKVAFAETGTADYIEVAQIAEAVLRGENGIPSEAALAVADEVRHLLVDEFQDTSRRQHRLLGHLIAAWTEREGRTCFVVGDPMQSIYFFRDADAELFPRVERIGFDIPHDLPLRFDSVHLSANFRSARELVVELNESFSTIFAREDGSGVRFARAEPTRPEHSTIDGPEARVQVHVEFMPTVRPSRLGDPNAAQERDRILAERTAASAKQTAEIVRLIGEHRNRLDQMRAQGSKYRIAVLGRTRKALMPIAQALRDAAIPFRALELEDLKQRPEVLDALALARALLNPQDRVAWLGVLRAPWCGLSLEDLHRLVSADDPELLRRPIPDLLAERRESLGQEGQAAVERVLGALEGARRLRFAQPAQSLGTWIERTWLSLGGANCVDAAGRANLEMLWRALDRLPEDELDLIGSALDTALAKLTALPDPDADGDYGVQLMTIHKSKGLEFEVVLVPDMQASTARGRMKLLSWLERGVEEADTAEEPTELLVAPLQSKGAERGTAKAWVDNVYRAREQQEVRRLFYVAATRAREELHLFARPECKTENDGSCNLAEPQESLLATAWPAVESVIRNKFEAWRARDAMPVVISAIADVDENESVSEPEQFKNSLLRRLPANFQIEKETSIASPADSTVLGGGQSYERHEGGILSRALGRATHTLLQKLAELVQSRPWDEARAALAQLEPRLAAQVRAAGIDSVQASRIAAQAAEIALKASRDPIGQWILSPNTEAASEIRWAGVVAGSLRTVQIDRVFRAGREPLTSNGNVWWVIDYKTAHGEGMNPENAVPQLREVFAPQIEYYARVLRNLDGADAAICGGLYYPRMLQFDWWEL